MTNRDGDNVSGVIPINKIILYDSSHTHTHTHTS